MKPTELRTYLYEEANKAMSAAGFNSYPQKVLQGCYSYKINEGCIGQVNLWAYPHQPFDFKLRNQRLISQYCQIGLRHLRLQARKVLRLIISILVFLIGGFASAAHSEQINEANIIASANDFVQSVQNDEEQDPPPTSTPIEPENCTGMLDWETVKRLQAKRNKTIKELNEKTLHLQQKHTHTTVERVALSKLHIDLAKRYEALEEFKQAAAEYKLAAKLLKNIKAEEELYRNALLSAQHGNDNRSLKTIDARHKQNR